MPELLTAISKRDLSRSITAYVAARPPYEQIETLANIFPDIDAAIDARPYVYHLGEDDASFAGFHVIERALYRDQRLNPHLDDVAIALNDSVNKLCDVLQERKRYSVMGTFEGGVALAFEVPAKKVASEEETWSDLSLMIFRNNYQGIWSQVSPFLSMVTPTKAAALRAAYNRVRRVLNLIDPKHPFNTLKGDARPYSSVRTWQRKMLIDATYVFAQALEVVRDDVFTKLSLSPAEEDEEDEDGEPSDIDDAFYASQVRVGLQHFVKQCAKQQTLLRQLRAAIKSSNLDWAKTMYGRTRPPYEQIEVLAGEFPDLDAYIDQRPYAVARGEVDEDWRGFHQVERALFRDGDLAAAMAGMAPLKDAVDELCDVLTDGADNGEGGFSATSSFDGMITLAYEVPAKKISSEEEMWSDLSVMIFRENIKGIWSQFKPFEDVLPKDVAGKVRETYMRLRTLIEYTVDKDNEFENGTKFTKYSDVPTWERKELSDGFYELGRALRMAKKALKKKA